MKSVCPDLFMYSFIASLSETVFLYSTGCPGAYYVAHIGLALVAVLLPQPPKYWYKPSCLLP